MNYPGCKLNTIELLIRPLEERVGGNLQVVRPEQAVPLPLGQNALDFQCLEADTCRQQGWGEGWGGEGAAAKPGIRLHSVQDAPCLKDSCPWEGGGGGGRRAGSGSVHPSPAGKQVSFSSSGPTGKAPCPWHHKQRFLVSKFREKVRTHQQFISCLILSKDRKTLRGTFSHSFFVFYL